MSDKKESSGWSSGCGTEILLTMAGLAALVGTIRLGPVDLARTAYNQIIGDTSVTKRELVDYSRKNMRAEHPELKDAALERKLAEELNYVLEGDRINPRDVSIEDLWDVSEDHASSWYQRWVWPKIN